MEDWAEIHRLYRSEKMPIKVIARVLRVSPDTVRAAIASDGPLRYARQVAGSIVDTVEPRIHELLQATPTMPTTVIAARIGWTRSIRLLSARSRSCGRFIGVRDGSASIAPWSRTDN